MEIKESCLNNDYKNWVRSCVTEMEEADKVGITSKVYHLVKRLVGKPKPPKINLTTDAAGRLLSSTEAIANE